MGEHASKADERQVPVGTGHAFVCPLRQDGGEITGFVLRLVPGPTVAYVTVDDGETFHRLKNVAVGEGTIQKVVGVAETDQAKVGALKAGLHEWKRVCTVPGTRLS